MENLKSFMKETATIARRVDAKDMKRLLAFLVHIQERRRRLFIAGLGGSAANASHAANDFRKLCDINAIALSDNVAELTARANDEGWDTIYSEMLKVSGIAQTDGLLVLSVGGGTDAVSLPLVRAIECAQARRAWVLAIVGRDGGFAAKHADATVLIPTVNDSRVTPHVESFQSVILHALVSHPSLQIRKTKW